MAETTSEAYGLGSSESTFLSIVWTRFSALSTLLYDKSRLSSSGPDVYFYHIFSNFFAGNEAYAKLRLTHYI